MRFDARLFKPPDGRYEMNRPALSAGYISTTITVTYAKARPSDSAVNRRLPRNMGTPIMDVTGL